MVVSSEYLSCVDLLNVNELFVLKMGDIQKSVMILG